jgi:Exopolysaccharide biosynthesis protein YbjH
MQAKSKKGGVWEASADRCTARLRCGCAALALLVPLAGPLVWAEVLAAEAPYNPFLPRPPLPWVNDFGGAGLLQTPLARSNPDGQSNFGFSYVYPYSRYFATVQALPWLEATLRYTSVANRFYGPEDFSGDQSYKDRGIDVKLRLLEAQADGVNLAIGLRDIAGTGLFGSEYLVADQTFGDFDVSLGLAWGNLGTRGHFRNPLGLLSKKFDRRGPGFIEGGGAISFSDFFRGRDVALFGGIQWRTPIEGVSLKAEYDPNTYQREPLDNRLKQTIPVNIGIDYRPWDWLQVGAGFERGHRVMLRFSGTFNFHEAKGPPKFDPPPPPLRAPTETAPAAAPAIVPVVAPLPFLPLSPPSHGDVQAQMNLARRAALEGLRLEGVERFAGGLRMTLTGTAWRDDADVAEAMAREALVLMPDLQGQVQVTRVSEGQPWLQLTFAADALRATRGARTLVEPASTPVPPLQAVAVTVSDDTLDEAVRANLSAKLVEQGLFLVASDARGDAVTLYVANGRYRQTAKALGRAARVAAAILPPRYADMRLTLVESSVEILSVRLMRDDVEKALTLGKGSLEELWLRTQIEEPQIGAMRQADHPPADSSYPGFFYNIRPALRQTLGRPEAFILYQAWVRVNGTVTFSPKLTLSGGLGLNIYNNFNKLRIPSDSVLPHVRSDIKDYLREGTTAMTHLQLDYATPLTKNFYGRLFGGYLEEMFGGFGGELLYKPFGTDWAISLDVAYARQRDFNQRFGFRPYDVVTGHLTGYYHIEPLGLDATVKVGRYLAGDRGATFDVSRTFDSGVTVGAFATFTNVSAAQFGEGRFDKGLYINIPLDNLYVRSSRGSLGFLFRPLTRDGGQILANRRPLIGLVDAASVSRLRSQWGQWLD